jgi:hypothetical protein
MDYEKDIHIDEQSLDVEWLEQPSLMMKYARISANARMELDRAKEELEFTRATLDKEIRSDPDKYGIDKVTEAVVLATIMIHKDYKEANNALINAKFESDIASSAIRAIDARKDALENLVRLHGMQYFAGPSIPRDITSERKKIQDKVTDGIAQKIRVRK